MRGSTHPVSWPGQRAEGGLALLTVLLLLLAVVTTSVVAARAALNGARVANHERDRMLALQAAMAALADAEHDIEGGRDPGSARAAALASATPSAFVGGCRGGAPYEGLCEPAPDARDIFVALADEEGPAVALGTFTGALMPSGAAALPARVPRYLIERMPSAAGALLYRVSALGFGGAASTQVAVQAYYRKVLAGGQGTQAGPQGAAPLPGAGPGAEPGTGPESGAGAGAGPRAEPGAGTEAGPEAEAPPAAPQAPASPASPALPGTPGGPGIRVGWREIANWHDIVASAGGSAGSEER